MFAYIMNHVSFDLMTPKSNHFIDSARYIHDPNLAGIYHSVLEKTRTGRTDGRTARKHNASGYFVVEAET